MKIFQLTWAFFSTIAMVAFSFLNASERDLPEEMQQIMHQAKYEQAIWGIYVKDIQTGKILFDLNSEKLFSPASTTKLFSIAALLHTFGDDYRFKTPVYASGEIKDGKLQGELILVAQGDLTMGGRQSNTDKIAFTKLDHIIANEVPGVILTTEDPLYGINELAKQVYQSGIKEITGDLIIDDSLFETIQKRGMVLSPIMINENLIDIIINPTTLGEKAELTWRPKVAGYTFENQVKTVANSEALSLEITSDDLGHKITIQGSIPLDQSNIIRTFAIKDPKFFARAAFSQALQNQGIKLNLTSKSQEALALNSYQGLQRVALWTSPPLSEYAKLILKVSHNLGADLVPLLLASSQGKKTFDEGMVLLGDLANRDLKLPSNTYLFIDAAGGNENRLTPQAEVILLEYLHKQRPDQFQHFFDALPILGVDGSLEDFGKTTQAVGKVRAKTGTGVAFNLANRKYFLITQALAGYITGRNGHLLAYMLVVNNGAMPAINDVFSIFEDQAQLSSIIYNHSD